MRVPRTRTCRLVAGVALTLAIVGAGYTSAFQRPSTTTPTPARGR